MKGDCLSLILYSVYYSFLKYIKNLNKKKGATLRNPFLNNVKTQAFVRNPLLRHDVQIFTVIILPSITVLILRRFGFHTLFVLFCAWLTLFPVITPFPHKSHLLAISSPRLGRLSSLSVFVNSNQQKFLFFKPSHTSHTIIGQSQGELLRVSKTDA